MIVYCAECGFQNPETANYCSRCGALLQKGEPSVETTQTLSAEEVGELEHDPVAGLEGPALVVRTGGGRAGETFRPALPCRRPCPIGATVRATGRAPSSRCGSGLRT